MSLTNRSLPTKRADATALDFSATPYGDVRVVTPFAGLMQACDEGAYYTAVNATDNTAITSSIATAYSGTASAFIALRNNDSNLDAGSGKRIFLDYIKLITKTVPASATDWRAVVDIDNVLTRFTSGGTALTPANANMQSNTTSVALVNAGALTTVALSASGRTLGRSVMRAVIPVTLETYVFTFGGVDKPSGQTDISVAKPLYMTVNFPPVVLGAGQCMCLSLFGTSNAATAATYQVEMGWIER